MEKTRISRVGEKSIGLVLILIVSLILFFNLSNAQETSPPVQTKSKPDMSGVWVIEMIVKNTDCQDFHQGDKMALLFIIDEDINGKLRVTAVGNTSYVSYSGMILDDGSFEISAWATQGSYVDKSKKSTFKGKLDKNLSGDRIISSDSCSIFCSITGHKI